MLASLRIELIGYAMVKEVRAFDALCGFPSFPAPWFVARILGPDPKYRWRREFLRPHRDYAQSNSVATRGVYSYYILESGQVYDIKQPVSWGNLRRYFARVDEEGNIIEITEREVTAWLPANRD